MDKKRACKAFVNDVSRLLGIAPRPVRFVQPGTLNGGVQAALTPGGIQISDDLATSPELFFAIAHELRHAWQLEQGASLEGYRGRDVLTSAAYNLQPLEIDANAFGLLAMRAFFGIETNFENHPQRVRAAIFKRVKEIEPGLLRP